MLLRTKPGQIRETLSMLGAEANLEPEIRYGRESWRRRDSSLRLTAEDLGSGEINWSTETGSN